MEKALKIKISVLGIKPEIYRVFKISNQITFLDLHKIIQLSFGWTNSHLFAFDVDNIYISDDEDDLKLNNKIEEFIYDKKQKLSYIYDFGDNWVHKIKIIEDDKESLEELPVCIEGKRNSPLEDCGGIPGYINILSILNDKNHEEYENIVEWIGDDFNPEEFDIDQVNDFIKNPDDYLCDIGDY